MHVRSLIQGLGLAAAVITLDQASKLWALGTLFDPPVRIIVTDFFNLVPVWNTGVSFGMLAGLGDWSGPLLGAFAIAVSLALLVWLARGPVMLVRLGLGTIVGGALGNAIDRFVHGAVVDFLDFHAMGYHWPAFNIADAAITLGVGLMILDAAIGSPDGEKA
jgi:signal peptidase II